MDQKKKKRDQKRYRLHSKIRKDGFNLITRNRTIYIHFDHLEISKEVIQLMDEFDYSVQLEIN